MSETDHRAGSLVRFTNRNIAEHIGVCCGHPTPGFHVSWLSGYVSTGQPTSEVAPPSRSLLSTATRHDPGPTDERRQRAFRLSPCGVPRRRLNAHGQSDRQPLALASVPKGPNLSRLQRPHIFVVDNLRLMRIQCPTHKGGDMHPIESGHRTQLIQEDRHREAALARRHSVGLSPEPKRRTWSIRLTRFRRQMGVKSISPSGMDC
jgi:hypothetical protein